MSQHHISLKDSNKSRYIFLNPDFIKIDEIMKKYVNIWNKKLDFLGVCCSITNYELSQILLNTLQLIQDLRPNICIPLLKNYFHLELLRRMIFFLRYSK